MDLAGKKWFSWTRLMCLAVTLLLLTFLFQRLDFASVWLAMSQMSVIWFCLGFVAYGLALLTGGVRWHLALSLVEKAIHVAASCRLFLIGHFLYVVLFGAVAGDLARSALYARWYRFGAPEVMASAPLDRLLGLGGSMVLGVVVISIALLQNGFANIRKLDVSLPAVWLLGVTGLAIALAGGFLLRRPKGEGWLARTLRAFRSGIGQAVRTPRTAMSGLALAFCAQAALTSVLAFNLRAVSQGPLPWAQIIWVFPAITIMSCLPITISGIGAREIAAVVLLGLYDIPANHCVAASLLTLPHSLVWAIIGAVVLGREESAYTARASRPLPQTISVVIPTLNEAEALPETLRRLRAVPEIADIIVVDGGSRDATCKLAAGLGCRVLSHSPGRGGQMRAGAMQATGDVVLLLHADTWLPPEAGRAILDCLRDQMVVGGGFWKVFRDSPVLLLGSRWRCAVRLFVGRRIAGDQAMFVRRSVLEQIGGVPDMPLMEEFELCRRLRKVGRLALARGTIITSARRFQKLGVVRTYLRMWRVSTLYWLGVSPHKLRQLYEKE